MAKIKLGAFVVGARGTIGGVTFSQNSSGVYAKAYRSPTRQRTTAQQIQRASMSISANEWAKMTFAEINAWNTFAASIAPAEIDPFGDPYRITGYSWFSRSTAFRALTGLAPLIAAPIVYNVNVTAFTSMTIRSTASGLNSQYAYPAGTYDATKFLYIKAIKRNTTGPVSSTVSMQNFIVDDNPPATQVFFQSELEAAFGEINVGQSMLFRIYVLDPDGYLSAPRAVKRIVV